MNDQEIIDRVRHGPPSPSRGSEECLSEATLAAYAEGAVDDEHRASVEAHLADCDLCLEQVALLGRLAQQPPAAVPAALVDRARDLVPADGREQRPWLRWGWTAAAALFLAIAAGLWTSSQRLLPDGPGVRAQRDVALPAQPGPTIVSPDTEGVLDSGDEIRWQEVPLALGYEISVMTLDGTLLFEERTEATVWRLPASDQLLVGESYYVWVRALLADGTTVRSPATRFVAGGQR